MAGWFRAATSGIALLMSAFVVVAQGAAATLAGSPQREAPSRGDDAALAVGYGSLPIAFEANAGQTDGSVRFVARGQGYGFFLTPSEAVLSLRRGSRADAATDPAPGTSAGAVIRMRPAGANPDPQVAGLEPLPGRSHYFIGNEPSRWRHDVAQFAKVRYAGIYPGIDLIFYGNQRQLEYDFVVAPGADPGRIALEFDGVTKLALDADGNLVLDTADGQLLQHRPVVYQDIGGARRAIDGRYVLRGPRRASFEVAQYDVRHPLVIDPTLAYSSYLGGSHGDAAMGVATDGNGNVYLAGFTSSIDFPATAASAYQAAFPPGAGNWTAFVAKLNTNASGVPSLVYASYLGGNNGEQAYAVAVDGSGNIYATGFTKSSNFPTTAGAYRGTLGTANGNAFIVKLNPSLSGAASLVYSTYLGGTGGGEQGNGIAVRGGNIHVTGSAHSTDFPTTGGAYQPTIGGPGAANAFVSRLDPSLVGAAQLTYSTFLGGNSGDSGNGIVVDAAGNMYVTGTTNSANFPTTATAFQTQIVGNANAFFAKLNPGLSGAASLLYSSCLGSSGSGDQGNGIAVDVSGNAYIAGYTSSATFPTTAGAYRTTSPGGGDAFVAKFNPAVSGAASLVYSSYLGGTSYESATSIAVDSSIAYVTGTTYSLDFPLSADAYLSSYPGGAILASPFRSAVVFFTMLNPGLPGAAALKYSTYLGGSGAFYLGGESGTGVAVDGSGNTYVAGYTPSSDFPLVNAYQGTNHGVTGTPPGYNTAFVARFATAAAPPTALAITNVNGGANPVVGASFNVVVQAQAGSGTPQNAALATAIGLSLHAGSGSLGGPAACTIPAGQNSCTVSGVTYSKAESGVALTATRTSGDTLTPGNSAAFTVERKATALAITSVNGGVNPLLGVAFSVVVQAQDAGGTPTAVVFATPIVLSRAAGTGTLGGTSGCTIAANQNTCTVSGVTYSKSESGVVLTATRTGGDVLTAGNSSPFTVDPPPPPTKLTLAPLPGFNPAVGVAFVLGAIALDASNQVRAVVQSTLITLTRQTGTGTLGGTLTCTIAAGTTSCNFSAITYSVAESGVSLTATASGGDALAPVTSPPFTVHPAAAPTQLGVLVSGVPFAGAPLPVLIRALDGTGVPQNVAAATAAVLSVHTGTGSLGGTLGCTIAAGASSCAPSSVTYSVAESGVVLTATRTSGDALAAGNSAPFTVWPGATYTVTYDGNTSTGGTVPVDSAPYATGATVTVLGNTGSLVKSGGYHFVGWNTQPGGTGAGYSAGSTFAMGAANVTLYAQWTQHVLDLDGNLGYDALTDGLLAVRYLMGLTGSALTSDALGAGATRTDPAQVKAYLDQIKPQLDVDGNGVSDGPTDGLLIIRYLFGLRGNALITGAVAPNATRVTAPLIEAYIQSLMP